MGEGKFAQFKSDAKAAGWSDWIKSEADERAVLEGCTFNASAGEYVCKFFSRFLRHSKGEWAGKPFELLDWQRDEVMMPLFGWMRADGSRRFRHAGIWVPKKNGKSTWAAGLALYMLVADGEPGAEVYPAATDREQAGIVHGEASRMVRASPELKARLIVTDSRKTIADPRTNSICKALSADVPTKQGLNWHFVPFDELHAQTKRDMWDVLRYGGASRRQPMLVSISTAGFDRHTIGYEQYEYAKGVVAGDFQDSSFFGYIKEVDTEDEWTDPKVWAASNPSFGVTVQEAEFAEACREAKQSPTKENAFRRYRLNQWTQQDVRWLSMDAWNRCDGEVSAEELSGRTCCGGLDLAKTRDMTALVLAFPREEGGFSLLPFFFMPEDNIEEMERRGSAPYTTWAREGFLILTPGNVTDYAFVREKIVACSREFDLLDVAYDPWNASMFANQLQDEDGIVMVEHRQGFREMCEPTAEFERLMLSEKLCHGGNPILRWHASNVTVKRDPAGNIKPDKQKSREKIDGVVAAVMAVSRAMAVGEPSDVFVTAL